MVLAAKHSGMRVDYTGMLRQAAQACRGDIHAFMLGELAGHLREMGERYYAGDLAAVDEFLQLYCVARDAREKAAATPPAPGGGHNPGEKEGGNV